MGGLTWTPKSEIALLAAVGITVFGIILIFVLVYYRFCYLDKIKKLEQQRNPDKYSEQEINLLQEMDKKWEEDL
jgi:type VI protein secretion system component VasK